jgi:hypothetical protein
MLFKHAVCELSSCSCCNAHLTAALHTLDTQPAGTGTAVMRELFLVVHAAMHATAAIHTHEAQPPGTCAAAVREPPA